MEENNSNVEPQASGGGEASSLSAQSPEGLDHKRFVSLRKPLDAACQIGRYGIDMEKTDLTQIKHKNISDDLQAVKVDIDKFDFGGVGKNEQDDLDHCILPLAKLRFLSETEKGHYAPKEQKTLARQIEHLEDEAKDIQFRYSRRKFLKGGLAAATVIGSAVACGKAVINPPTPEITKTTGPTATETFTPTQEATPTIEPTEAAPRYTEILPATLEECKANNVIRWSNFEEDWKEFTDLVDAKNQINMNLVEPFTESISKLPSPPTTSIVSVDNPNKLPGVSCSYVDFENGSGVYVLGLPIVRPNSPNVPPTVLYFAVDDVMLDKHIYDIKPSIKGTDLYGKYYDLSVIYPKIVSGQYDSLSVTYIYNPFDSNQGIWGNLNELFPTTDRNEFMELYAKPISYVFSEGGTLITEEMAANAFKKAHKMIIPSAYITVSY
jgi:hypothetical protein